MADQGAARTRETLGLAILFFAFLQALTIWIESIYRLSLIKLSMGAELLGIFLFLL
ncbi:MAG: hypothetical protein HYV26_02485, partial [Candidatus Hydrogenedentes bacterium]|nr:hypothetical protein [Candidatus Hydrogenedentota bacterium]